MVTLTDRSDYGNGQEFAVGDLTSRVHPEILRHQREQANILGHACRYCMQLGCDERDLHARAYNANGSVRRLDDQRYWECPHCGGDVRTAVPCYPVTMALTNDVTRLLAEADALGLPRVRTAVAR